MDRPDVRHERMQATVHEGAGPAGAGFAVAMLARARLRRARRGRALRRRIATAYSIARRHGGFIPFDPEGGPGATFTIYLPAAATALPAALPEAVSTHRSGCILVMDDEPMVREVLGVVLPYLGHRVETVEGGAEAVAAYRRALAEGRRFDVVILDLTIPGGTGGLDTLAALRALDPAVVAVVSSGYSDDAVMADPGRFGFAAVPAKPFTVDAVSRVLAPLLAPPVAPPPVARGASSPAS